jgi:hypothetical protein
MINAFNMLGLFNNKHIPDVYKYNSREVRLQVLAGLIDTDGYNASGCYEITQKSKQLADDIEYLAFSLGFMVTRTLKSSRCMYKGEYSYGEYHRMIIFGEGIDKIPVTLDRKKMEPRLAKNRATCLRFDVQSLGTGTYHGFQLDGDGRFLLGDFLVTHNTTVIGEIVHNLELREMQYMVVSFTGKAVARVREVIKRGNTATMHKMISRFNPNNKFKHLIIDEASMVTTELFYNFITAYTHPYAITFVGDINQLEPISWGNLFKEMVESNMVKTARLTVNQRSKNSSGQLNGIIHNSEALINYINRPKEVQPEPFRFTMTPNFWINSVGDLLKATSDFVTHLKAQGVPRKDFVIISPYKKDLDTLNEMVQSIYNTGQEPFLKGKLGPKWMVGDRIMMKENNYEINIMNGEEGEVIELLPQRPGGPAITVRFKDGTQHDFRLFSIDKDGNQLDVDESQVDPESESEDSDLTVKMILHSSALTTHRAQGSEWPICIIYLPLMSYNGTYTKFVNRNMIYTMITRPKAAVYAMADQGYFEAAAVIVPPIRHEKLGARLVSSLTPS